MLTDVSFSLFPIFQQGHSEPRGFGVFKNILYFQNFLLELGTLILNFISQLTGNEGE